MTILIDTQAGSSASQNQSIPVQTPRPETNLSYRYGSIGIEAVAAAVRYAGTCKNPAYAPVVPHFELRHSESSV